MLKLKLREKQGVNFTNILRAAFMRTEPKSAKKTVNLSSFFALLGSAGVKAAQIEIERETRGQFHQPNGAKHKCASTKSLVQSVSSTKLCPTLLVNRTRSSAQLLLFVNLNQGRDHFHQHFMSSLCTNIYADLLGVQGRAYSIKMGITSTCEHWQSWVKFCWRK